MSPNWSLPAMFLCFFSNEAQTIEWSLEYSAKQVCVYHEKERLFMKAQIGLSKDNSYG